MDKHSGVVPKLRFPEFRNAGVWENKALGEVAKRITHKNKDITITRVLTNSARDGIVDQRDYFDKDIANKNNLSGYYIVKEGDYIYNPRISTNAPVGPIGRNKIGTGIMSPLYSIFQFKKNETDFYEQYFKTTCWYKYIRKVGSSGARHDRMSISTIDFMNMSVPEPYPAEQQKIADCLSSIDALITAQAKKLDTLKDHKKGLMQHLFPAEGKTVPKLRFPEFRDSGAWNSSSLGEISTIKSGGTPSRSLTVFWNGLIPWITTSHIDFNTINTATEHISEVGLQESSAKIFPKGTILMAMYGQGKTRGKVAILGLEASTNQACAAIILNKNMNIKFVFQNLAAHYNDIRDISNEGGQKNLSATLIKRIPFLYPSTKTDEQKKIADCLFSIDKLITAHTEKLHTLKTHKKGLMQQLFPSTYEVYG